MTDTYPELSRKADSAPNTILTNNLTQSWVLIAPVVIQIWPMKSIVVRTNLFRLRPSSAHLFRLGCHRYILAEGYLGATLLFSRARGRGFANENQHPQRI